MTLAQPSRAPGWPMRLAMLLALLFSSLLVAAQQLAPIPPLDSPVVDTTGTLDAAIYGSSREVKDSLEQLRGFADQRFNKKMEEVKHG